MRSSLCVWTLLCACGAAPPPRTPAVESSLDAPAESEVDETSQPVPADPEEAATQPPVAAKAPKPPASSAIVLPPLAAEDQIDYDENGRRRIGAHRELPEIPAGAAWTVDAEGAPVWRATIRATGAVALRLHFVSFHVGAGRVTVREAEEDKQAEGRSYTGDGPAGDGELWSDILEGDSAIIEYRPGDSSVKSGDVPFRIDKASHMWASPLDAF